MSSEFQLTRLPYPRDFDSLYLVMKSVPDSQVDKLLPRFPFELVNTPRLKHFSVVFGGVPYSMIVTFLNKNYEKLRLEWIFDSTISLNS